MSSFRNKNCLIVGASGGIGMQIAEKMSEFNYDLFLVGRNKNKLSTIRKRILSKNKSIKIEFESADLTNDKSINQLIKKIRKKFGSIDILINTAGAFIIKSIEDSSVEAFDENFKINVRAPFIF